MKKVMFLATIVAAMMVCAPASAQTRKQKKEAQTAAWEQQQRQQQEEAALLHQMKMDSIRNAQKVQADAAKQAELAAKRAQEKAEADQRRAEQEALHQEKEVIMPCMGDEFMSSSDIVRATGIGESMQQQMAKRLAYSNAVKELTGKISTTMNALFVMYVNDEMVNMDETLQQKYEGMQQEKIEQTTGYRTICEKYTSYINNAGRKIFKCYLAIEIGIDEILKPVYDQIQEADQNKLNVNYDKFKEDFNKEFEKNVAE